MTRPILPLVAALVALFPPSVLWADTVGERLCLRVAAPRGARPAPAGPFQIADRFGARALGTGDPELLCQSARWVSGPDVTLPPTLGLRVVAEGGHARAVGERLDVHTRLGMERVRVRGPALLAFDVQTTGPLTAVPGVCYALKARPGRRGVTTVLAAGREEALRVGPPRRFCVSAGGSQHLCHRARRVARERLTGDVLDFVTTLGTQRLELGHPAELCVAVTSAGPPPPPPPPFTLRINPASLEMTPGESGRLTVTAFLEEGGSEDFGDRVTWVSSDDTIAVVRSSAGGALVDAVGRGTAIISAVDPESGISSADSGGDAEITVVWPLEKLTISPPAVRKKVGESEEYTVTGHFTGGTTMNLTQRVTYRSSYPAVALAPNTPGHRSRVRALAPGVAWITATDPISRITTTDSENDAVLRVGGGMPYIQIDPEREYRLVLRLGDTEQLTAVGYYPDASTKNLTQRCVWSSTDLWAPAGGPVLLTPNTDGDRSRIEAAATGTARVQCLDPESGRAEGREVDVVSDQLVALRLSNGVWPPLHDDIPRQLTALGTFAPFELDTGWEQRGARNLTQDVVYVSRDPDIAIATNTPGDRSRIDGVAPGVARIYAFDPVSGLESPDHRVENFGRLIGIMLNHGSSNTTSRALVMTVGSQRIFTVRGVYEGERLLKLSDPAVYVLESGDPTIVRVAADVGRLITGLAAGRTSVTVRHLPTGLVSDPFEVTVKGSLSAIEIEPSMVTRALGEEVRFKAFGLFPPDFREWMTYSFEFRSSDPSVAVVTNDLYHLRGVVRTVGAGTAVISAVDPVTGVSSSDAGGDAVIEVLPGAIERVTVEPVDLVLSVNGFHDYTAIGHYADGRTINVTTQVQWAVTDVSVANAPSFVGGNSRIQAVGPGTTRVVATHRSGVSSTESDDDARLTVRPLASVTLTPATRVAKAGTSIRYTVSGTLDDGTPVNLTQRASYWIEPWEAARVPNDDDDRSRFDLLLPGPATVYADIDGWRLSAELTIEP